MLSECERELAGCTEIVDRDDDNQETLHMNFNLDSRVYLVLFFSVWLMLHQSSRN